jgi:hypothetical protein
MKPIDTCFIIMSPNEERLCRYVYEMNKIVYMLIDNTDVKVNGAFSIFLSKPFYTSPWLIVLPVPRT